MSRRTAGLTALAATLVVGGFVPVLVGGASADGGCPTWTDAKGDSNTGQLGNQTGQQGDANLDIVAASLTVTPDSITAVIKTDKLNATASDQGDEFHVLFTAGGKDLMIYSDRAGSEFGSGPEMPVGTDAGFYNWTDSTKAGGTAKAVYDVKASTVTITGKLSDVAKLAAVPLAGKPATKLVAESQDYFYGADGGFLYDDAPTALTTTLGVDCAGGGGPAPAPTGTPSPTPSPTPSATPSPTPSGGPAPEGFPRTGCFTYTDIKGDGNPTPVVGAPGLGNDPDLDYTGAAYNTKDGKLQIFLFVDKLADLPSKGEGHRFETSFKVGAKVVNLIAGQTDAVASNYTVKYPYGQLDGTSNADLMPKVTWDKAHNTIIYELGLDKLSKATGATVENGFDLTGTAAVSKLIWTPTHGTIVADNATAAVPTDAVYKVGVSPCFTPPPAVLANAGAVTSQYGDPARVAAKLTSKTGAALAGKRVTFGLAGRAVVAKTNAAGIASASIPLSVTVSVQKLSVAFAGDATADKATISVPFTVTQEKTKLILSVTKKGTARTVTALLLDDDNHVVAGQKVVVAVNGKNVATLTTASNGKVTYTKAKPGQTVKVTLAAVKGKYLGTSAQVKV